MHSNFTPIIQTYPYDNWKHFSHKQRRVVQKKNMEYGWTYRNTPPPAFRLNDEVKHIINTVIVSSLIAQISEVNTEKK